jgi:hypothetical protein
MGVSIEQPRAWPRAVLRRDSAGPRPRSVLPGLVLEAAQGSAASRMGLSSYDGSLRAMGVELALRKPILAAEDLDTRAAHDQGPKVRHECLSTPWG